MKKYYLIIVTLLLTLVSYSQVGDGFDYLERDSYVQEEDVARIEIKLLPGTTVAAGFTTSGNENYHAYIDPFLPINGYSSGEFYVNYIRAYAPIKDNASTIPPVHGTFDYTTEWNEKIVYFDGLGREMQNVLVAASPEGRDIIQPIIYDDFGRNEKEYMAYPVKQQGDDGPGGFRPQVIDEQLMVIQAYYNIDHNYTYAKKRFDDSPLNRVIKQSAPGEEWNLETGATIDYSYNTNSVNNEAYRFSIENGNQLKKEGCYTERTLFKNTTFDENVSATGTGNKTIEYKDKSGKVVQKSTWDGLNWLITYYIYDEFDLLRYVIPPKANTELPSGTTPQTFEFDDDWILNLCYYYEYDERKRIIKKRIPGKEMEYMVYDNRNRLVLTQDGNLRSEDFWMFTKYDVLNRPVQSGKYHNAEGLTFTELINEAKGITVYYETLDLQSENGYTNDAFPELASQTCVVHSVTFYDNYDYISQNNNYDFVPNGLVTNYNTEYTKSKVTATKTKILPTEGMEYPYPETWVSNAIYYDEYDRVIQTVSNLPIGGKEVLSNQYNFTGELLKTQQDHLPNNTQYHTTIKQVFDYDHAGRLLQETHQINDEPAVELTNNGYEELGQLSFSKLGKAGEDKSWLQKVDYGYNMRSWLTNINDVEKLGSDYYSIKLKYTSGNTPQYNGNISTMASNYGTLSGVYNFSYDAMNRLKIAEYEGDGNYSSAYTYDLNGNITSLQRFGYLGNDNNFAEIDILDYDYEGNRLKSVNDIPSAGSSFQTFGFIDNGSYANGTYEYGYDANGNMVKDDNKQIFDIKYNHLNLPKKVDIVTTENNNSIYYIYSATGTKLHKLAKTNGAIYSTTDYFGNFVYENNLIKYILTSVGRIVPNLEGDGFDYQYYINDHLENTRIMFNHQGILQINSYYPFGMLMEGFGANTTSGNLNKYLYNGKELQDDFELDWYDYGARFYDAQIGRWHVLDRISEKYLSFSPYTYSFNNPINFYDPDGNDPREAGTEIDVRIKKSSVFTSSHGAEAFSKEIRDKSLYDKADAQYMKSSITGLFMSLLKGPSSRPTNSTSAATSIMQSGFENALIEGTQTNLEKAEGFVAAAQSDSYTFGELTGGNDELPSGMTVRTVSNLGKGYESEVISKIEYSLSYSKNDNGEIVISKTKNMATFYSNDIKEGVCKIHTFTYKNGKVVDYKITYQKIAPRKRDNTDMY